MPLRPFEGYYQNPYAPIPSYSPDTSTIGRPGRPSYTVFQNQGQGQGSMFPQYDLGAFANLPPIDFSDLNAWRNRASSTARRKAGVQTRRLKTQEPEAIEAIRNQMAERGIFSSGIRVQDETQKHTEFSRARQDVATSLAEALANIAEQYNQRRSSMAMDYAGQFAGSPPPMGAIPGGREAIVKLGQQLAAQRGWSGNQWNALYRLWMGESGWNPRAANPTSSARGIPQTMMSIHFGKNWQNNPAAQRFLSDPRVQLIWGLDYIRRRYGDPMRALNFWNRNRYY